MNSTASALPLRLARAIAWSRNSTAAGAVVQAGERVVGGLVHEALLEPVALDDRAGEHGDGLLQRLAETARERLGEDRIIKRAFGERARLGLQQAQVRYEVVERLRGDHGLLRPARPERRQLEVAVAHRPGVALQAPQRPRDRPGEQQRDGDRQRRRR